MKRLLLGLALVAAMVLPAVAQDYQYLPNLIFKPTDPSFSYNGALSFKDIGGTARGTDGYVFLPAPMICVSDTTTLQNGLLPIRIAANTMGLRRTSGGTETLNITCTLDNWLQYANSTGGIKITGMTVSHGITVADMTSFALNGLKLVTYASGSAISAGSSLATIAARTGYDANTFATTSTSNPYLTTLTITTPAALPAATNKSLTLDMTAVLPNTAVFTLYGVGVNFTRIDH